MPYKTSADRVEAIRQTLFPPETPKGDRSTICHDADENLDAALYDLKRLKADPACIRTIERVLKQIHDVRLILLDT